MRPDVALDVNAGSSLPAAMKTLRKIYSFGDELDATADR